MIRALLILLPLAACHGAPSAMFHVSRHSLALSAGCPQGVPEPPPPGEPRTVKSIAEWAARLEAARAETEHARVLCEQKLDRLVNALRAR